MQSTFAGIELGKRSLVAQQQGLATIGHNLANASTEGYSRQRVDLEAMEPLYLPGLNREETPGQVGQGAVVQRLERVRDALLDKRIIAQTNGEGYWSTRDTYILMLERLYNEPDDVSVRGRMDAFWDAWQELSLFPAEAAPRQAVLERGQTLVDAIHERYKGLSGLRDMADADIRGTVDRVNDIVSRVATLNDEIQKIRAQGDSPNDLYDRRDLLVEELAGIIDITIDDRDPDEYTVHTAGLIVVQGGSSRRFDLKLGLDNEGYADVVWKQSGEKAVFSGGSLAALIELRDISLRSEIQSLDTMTMNFADLVNEIHAAGVGINGRAGENFFVERPFVTDASGNYDRDGDGFLDSSYIFRLTGAHKLDARDHIGLEGTLTLAASSGPVSVPYYASDTVNDLVARVNDAGAEVVARLDREGRFVLKATSAADPAYPDFVIRDISDSGRFLEGYAGILAEVGEGGAYTWDRADAVAVLAGGGARYSVAPVAHPSAWMEINPALKKDTLSIAAGFAEAGQSLNPGNGEAAIAIAALRRDPVMVGRLDTFDDYFADAVARVGLLGEQSERALETQSLIMKQLKDMRQSISGVNIDEELSDMIKYQHGYSAAARFVTTVNEMLDTIINRMGV